MDGRSLSYLIKETKKLFSCNLRKNSLMQKTALFSSIALVLLVASVFLPGIPKNNWNPVTTSKTYFTVPSTNSEYTAFHSQPGTDFSQCELKSSYNSVHIKKTPLSNVTLLSHPSYSFIINPDHFSTFTSQSGNTSRKNLKSAYLLDNIPPPFFNIYSQV
jgi:hypothetical protein